jgi:CHAT domain-containing protein/ketosteroid isomerase-like protein
MRPAATVSIEPSPGALRWRLELAERDVTEPLQEEVRHPVDDATLRALQETADALLRSAESPRFPDEARARGVVLYRTLVPPRLRERLSAVRGPVLVTTSLYGIPWELLHDGEEFWGLRYALGKRLVMDRPLPAPPAMRLPGRPRALVVGSDPRGDLPFVAHEVEAICDVLEGNADVECVTGRLASFDRVTTLLGRGFDVVHYCGHVVADAESGPALLLADGKTLPAPAIEAILAGRPLVFLNGCASARGGSGAPTAAWEETFSGVAYGFLFGGALGVVGTLADVSDRHAATLAAAFYRGALERAPIGEALRAARAAARADPASAASPTWLSVVLYGNPAQVLLRGPEDVSVVPAPARTPVPAPVAERRRRPTALRLAAFVLFALVLVAGLLQLRPAPPPRPLVVGVMAVQSRGPHVPAWMREITRDGLNTILSKFGGLQVYSRQKIDFVREKRQIGELEAAEALGMSKMLSAIISSDGAHVTLELEVVDIATGLLDRVERVEGPAERFMELQTDFAVRALHALGVQPTDAELQAVLASRGAESLDVYRMFKDTLGDPAPAGEAPAPAPKRKPGTSWLNGPAVAYAQETTADETAIRGVLTQYGAALQAKDSDALAALQLEMSEGQRTALARYFGTARDLRVRIANVDVTIEGDEALATFTREDVFLDAGTGREMRLEVRISGILQKQQGTWKIRGLREPS